MTITRFVWFRRGLAEFQEKVNTFVKESKGKWSLFAIEPYRGWFRWLIIAHLIDRSEANDNDEPHINGHYN